MLLSLIFLRDIINLIPKMFNTGTPYITCMYYIYRPSREAESKTGESETKTGASETTNLALETTLETETSNLDGKLQGNLLHRTGKVFRSLGWLAYGIKFYQQCNVLSCRPQSFFYPFNISCQKGVAELVPY